MQNATWEEKLLLEAEQEQGQRREEPGPLCDHKYQNQFCLLISRCYLKLSAGPPKYKDEAILPISITVQTQERKFDTGLITDEDLTCFAK